MNQWSVWSVFLVMVSGHFAGATVGHSDKLFFSEASEAEGKIVYASLGSTAVLECEAGGHPNPLIHWLRNGQRIRQGSSWDDSLAEEPSSAENTENNVQLKILQLSATKSRLFIDCVTASEAGKYTCVAETQTKRIATDYLLKVDAASILEKMRSGEYPSAKVNQISHGGGSCLHKRNAFEPAPIPARIYMWTLHRIEVEGADVQLYCRPTGSGPIKVTWLDRNDKPITKRDTRYQVLETGDLLIKSVEWAENMGVYRCVAENLLGSGTIETFLYPTSTK